MPLQDVFNAVMPIIFAFGIGFAVFQMVRIGVEPTMYVAPPKKLTVAQLEEDVLGETGWEMADRIEREFDAQHTSSGIRSFTSDCGKLTPLTDTEIQSKTERKAEQEIAYENLTMAELAYLSAQRAADEFIQVREVGDGYMPPIRRLEPEMDTIYE